ncbi:alpha/beta hydrolase [Rhizobium sp. K102]|uniref:alpha/beta fold hydrolase n=1 Tax=Rhizobium sp. K102 TaxID=2918527 RepID=UPI001EFBCCC9|nr:alpha/beta hydrolase [Rhizobium sp. K102]ULR45788.1 alpha/beta hydrolase [Rhizobium sp. K102]
MANFALKVIRLGFLALQAVSPQLAGRAAFLLFCRTPSQRPKGGKAKAAHAAGAARLAGAERFVLKLSSGAKAHAYRLNGGALGKRKRYLVTHGWGSSAVYMADLVSTLAATGAEVVALDFPGHGRARGRFLHMGLAVEAIAAAEERFGAFDAAIGHSFGGAALMVSAAALLPDAAPVTGERLVLIGAPSEMAWLFTDFGRLIGLGAAAQAVLENEVHRVTGRRTRGFRRRQYGRYDLEFGARGSRGGRQGSLVGACQALWCGGQACTAVLGERLRASAHRRRGSGPWSSRGLPRRGGA